MKTFDLAEVRGFTADLDARMARCDNGEGFECANFDAMLGHYAKLCCELVEAVRAWGRAVFTGHVAFDQQVELLWKNECVHLYRRAWELAALAEQAEGPCYALDGKAALFAALLRLYQLITPWVTPKLALSPSARTRGILEPAALEEVRQRVYELPPPPEGWQPDDPRQQALFRKLKTP